MQAEKTKAILQFAIGGKRRIFLLKQKTSGHKEDRGGSKGQNQAEEDLLSLSPHSFVSVEVVKGNRWRLNPENRSSWLQLTRVTLWVHRFVVNYHTKIEERLDGPRSVEEIILS